MVCTSEEVRIGFQFDMSEGVLGKLQLASWVMDFTLKTNSSGLALRTIGRVSICLDKLGSLTSEWFLRSFVCASKKTLPLTQGFCIHYAILNPD